MSYDSPITATYTLAAATLSTAADLLSVMGPSGYTGRLESIGAVITTATTVAATELRVGTSTDADDWGTLSVPVATAGNGYNSATINTSDSNLITADTPLIIATDGGCTAGAADITVTVSWFK